VFAAMAASEPVPEPVPELIRHIEGYLENGVLVPGTVSEFVRRYRDMPLPELFATINAVLAHSAPLDLHDRWPWELCQSVLAWLHLRDRFFEASRRNDREGRFVRRDVVQFLAGMESEMDMHFVMYHAGITSREDFVNWDIQDFDLWPRLERILRNDFLVPGRQHLVLLVTDY